MKKLALFLCIAVLIPVAGVQAHQERHVHSQWIQQKISQLHRTIDQLRQRIDRLEQGGGPRKIEAQPRTQSSGKNILNETCRPGQQKLCQKSCAVGWRLEKAICIGNGSIGKTTHNGNAVSCYCFSQNDPNCIVKGITATCIKP